MGDNNTSIIELIEIQEPSTNNTVPMIIKLNQRVDKKDIHILFKDEPITFDYKKDTITLEVYQNGKYTIQIQDEVANTQVNSINNPQLIVVGYTKYDNYIQFNVDERISKVDYKNSFVLSNDIEYRLDSNNRIYGDITGEIHLYISNEASQFAFYTFDIE